MTDPIAFPKGFEDALNEARTAVDRSAGTLSVQGTDQLQGQVVEPLFRGRARDLPGNVAEIGREQFEQQDVSALFAREALR